MDLKMYNAKDRAVGVSCKHRTRS